MESDSTYFDEGDATDTPEEIGRKAKSNIACKATSSVTQRFDAKEVVHRLNQTMQSITETRNHYERVCVDIDKLTRTLYRDLQTKLNAEESLKFLVELLHADKGTAEDPQTPFHPMTTPVQQQPADSSQQDAVIGSRTSVLFERLLLCLISHRECTMWTPPPFFIELLKADDQNKTAADVGGFIKGDMTSLRSWFGVTAAPGSVNERLDIVYDIVARCAANTPCEGIPFEPIYGELTLESMQSIIDVMKEKTNFNTESVFLDIGSGMDKPNFHAAKDPGVALSIGYESSEHRRNLSEVCKNRLSSEEVKVNNCHFAIVDAALLPNLNGFTHVYMFDTG